MKVRKIENLSSLENAIADGLEMGDPIKFVDEQKRLHCAIFYSKQKIANGEDSIVTIEEDKTRGTKRDLYVITKEGINYRSYARGNLDEDLEILRYVEKTLEYQKEAMEEIDDLLCSNRDETLKYKSEAMKEINSLFRGKLYES